MLFKKRNSSEKRKKFYKLYNAWRRETCMYSVSDPIYSNKNFKEIVKMGEDAVPYILEIISKTPDNIIAALPQILDEDIVDNSKISKWQGFTSLKRACKLWRKKLKNYKKIS